MLAQRSSGQTFGWLRIQQQLTNRNMYTLGHHFDFPHAGNLVPALLEVRKLKSENYDVGPAREYLQKASEGSRELHGQAW